MSRFDQMTAFVRTVEAGSLTRAAEVLGVDKSAVSRRVSDLESRLGVQLLVRGSRALSLTPEGETFLARARDVLADLAEAEGEAKAGREGLSGPIRISVPLSYGLNRLSPALVAFMEQHPDVRLDVDFSDRVVDLLGDGFDMAVRVGRLADSALIARKLEHCEMWVAASPAFLGRHGSVDTLADLSALPEIRYGLRTRSTWDVQTLSGATYTLEMQCAHRTTNGDFAVRAAVVGLGVCIEPDFILGDAVEQGGLVRLLPDHTFPGVTAHIVWPPSRHLTARSRALIEHLTAWCSESRA